MFNYAYQIQQDSQYLRDLLFTVLAMVFCITEVNIEKLIPSIGRNANDIRK